MSREQEYREKPTVTAEQLCERIEKGFKENVLPTWKEWEKQVGKPGR
jgi:hypothetical protein